MIELPGYTIQRELGHGGMATVYLALQDSLQRPVALKVMAPALAADRTFSERFLREGRTVGQLSHPHIVSVFDIGVVEHCHYIAMEYVPDGDLKSRLQGGISVEPRQAMMILRQMAQALSYAHGRGFVHRDVKPENILFRDDGEAVLSDFGIAKSLTGGTRMTGTGMSIGTPHYMSPEQARGKTVDGRADFYSLGVVFYEMLTGRVPYDADDSLAIGIKHISEPVPELPADVQRYQALVDRLLAKDPDRRVQNAGELQEVLLDMQNSGARKSRQSATRVMPSAPPQQSQSRASGLIWGLGGALLAGMFALGFYWREMQRPTIRGGGGSGSSLDYRQIHTSALQEYSDRSVISAPSEQQTPEERNESEIAELLQSADKNIDALRLTYPQGDNALEKYRAVLKLDSANVAALKGLEAIVEHYLELADEHMGKMQFNKAKSDLDKASRIGPLRSDIQIYRKRLAKSQAAYEEQNRLAALDQQRLEKKKQQTNDKQTVQTKKSAPVKKSVDSTRNSLLTQLKWPLLQSQFDFTRGVLFKLVEQYPSDKKVIKKIEEFERSLCGAILNELDLEADWFLIKKMFAIWPNINPSVCMKKTKEIFRGVEQISSWELAMRRHYNESRWVKAYAEFGKIDKEYSQWLTDQSLREVKQTILGRLKGQTSVGGNSRLPRLKLQKNQITSVV